MQYIKNKIDIKLTAKSLNNGPVIRNKGNKTNKQTGKLKKIYFSKLFFNITSLLF